MKINRLIRFISFLLLAIPYTGGFVHPLYGQTEVNDPTNKLGPSGLPLPRFVSLKADKVNVRLGPSTEHRVAWVFRRAGLPVEIIAEFENWRRVRDSEGQEGWVFHSLLSGRRTALVMPWALQLADPAVPQDISVSIYERANESSKVVARIEAGALINIVGCSGTWCNLTLDGFNGWIEQEKLWGVYKGEILN